MKSANGRLPDRSRARWLLPCVVLLAAAPASALSGLSVVDQSESAVADFRWLLELDTTHPVSVGTVDPTSVGVSIHRSHAPVATSGTSSDLGALFAAVDPAQRYYLSVLPGLPGGGVAVGDFSVGGAPIAPGQDTATVRVNANPLPSAQMTVYAFRDDSSLNSEPDVGRETGLAGFEVRLYDALLGEQSLFDFCGNPLGTTYDGPTCDDVLAPGSGIILTGPDGEVTLQNIYPGKYAVEVVPTTTCPDGSSWIQTSTIEGTPEVDAWVEAGAPKYLPEFGYLAWHAFFGFVCQESFPAPAPGAATATVTGTAVQRHMATPPLFDDLPGIPIPNAIVGVNDLGGGDDQVYTGFADPVTGAFSIPDVPPGLYQMVLFDRFLDAIIAFRTFTVNSAGDDVDIGFVTAEMWFNRIEGVVFYDTDEDGYRDPTEVGISQQGVGLRFRDGSIYQVTESQPAPEPGIYSFDEIFPFIKYLILEINFDRFKATGASFQVDIGGLPGDPPGVATNPQTPPAGEECGDDPTSRCETGIVLLEATTTSLTASNSRASFGKKAYVVGPDNLLGTADDVPGENGGLAGIVYYASTRAELDPRLSAGDDWEPGVPRAEVVLYQDTDGDGNVDDIDGNPGIQYADVDNHPLGWSEGGAQGPEDVERDGQPGFGLGDALEFVHTDSFDDKVPDMAPCPGPLQTWKGTPLIECAETLRTGSQIRPQVFDGGYALLPPPGRYVIEAVAPPGYEHVKDGDLNVLTGDSYVPGAPPAECVGDPYLVPATLNIDGVTENPSPRVGTTQKGCNRKKVRLAEGENQALMDFFVFTAVPKAGRIVALVTDDIQSEPDPDHPRFGDKLGVPWIPVSVQDFAGHELNRVHTDEFGSFDALVPSTWTANVPSPSGFAPNMVKVVLNPRILPDGTPDPTHNASYMEVSYVREVMPAKTSYLDIPTLPRSPRGSLLGLDCHEPSGTPRLARVDGPGGGPVAAPGEAITLTSLGTVPVPNPLCSGQPSCSFPPTVLRDFGFGASEDRAVLGSTVLPIVSWSDGTIVATVPAGTLPGPYQLRVRRAGAARTRVGLTVHVVGPGYDPAIVRVTSGSSLQAAIDAAAPGSLVLVESGVYRQNPLIWKRLKLQGYGAGSTVLDGSDFGLAERQAWSALLHARIASGDIALVTGQDPAFDLVSGVTVAWFGDSPAAPSTPPDHPLLDGFAIRGGTRGGGVHVNAFVGDLEISNNEIEENQGNFGGGIRLGTPTLPDGTGLGWLSSENPNARIHHNQIAGNGGVSGGGGVALFTGSDGYDLTHNLICGNFSLVYGGGIQHFGLSPGGLIEDNEIRFNQAFDEGGGLFIGSELLPAGAPSGAVPPGAGDVTVNRNRLLANLAFDDGAGIRVLDMNGQDVAASSDPTDWYRLRITNNMIVNNVSNDVGGGISLDDALRAEILHNTIAYNNSTATNEDNFGVLQGGPVFGDPLEVGQLGVSTPLPAGLASRPLDAALQAALPPGATTFSQPLLFDNILVGNRAFYFDSARQDIGFLIAADGPDSEFTPPPGQPDFFNLGVYGGSGAELLAPQYCVLMALQSEDATSFSATNLVAPVNYAAPDPDALFVSSSVNEMDVATGGLGVGLLFTVTVELLAPSAYDHHLVPTALAVNRGSAAIPGGPYPELAMDFDSNPRPGTLPDIGADEVRRAAARGCGLGAELALVLPVLLWLRRRVLRGTSR